LVRAVIFCLGEGSAIELEEKLSKVKSQLAESATVSGSGVRLFCFEVNRASCFRPFHSRCPVENDVFRVFCVAYETNLFFLQKLKAMTKENEAFEREIRLLKRKLLEQLGQAGR